jgi:hypothetical protein
MSTPKRQPATSHTAVANIRNASIKVNELRPYQRDMKATLLTDFGIRSACGMASLTSFVSSQGTKP